MIPADDQKNLPEDENTPEKRAEKIWEFFGKKDNGNLEINQERLLNRCPLFTFTSTLGRWWRFSFSFLFPPDKISEGEFIQAVMDNKDILRLIQYDEPQKIKDKLKEKKQ